MITTRRTEVMFDLGDLLAPKGSVPWIKAVHEELRRALRDADITREHLQMWMGLLREGDHYQLLADAQGQPFLMWEAYCTAPPPYGLGYSPEAIDRIIAERKSAQQRAQVEQTKEPLPQRGEIGRGRNRSDKVTPKSDRGNDADYLTARIARDRPDILDRMKAGEFASVRAAAKEAGIVKDRVSIEPTVDGLVRAVLRHPERTEIIARLQHAAAADGGDT